MFRWRNRWDTGGGMEGIGKIQVARLRGEIGEQVIDSWRRRSGATDSVQGCARSRPSVRTHRHVTGSTAGAVNLSNSRTGIALLWWTLLHSHEMSRCRRPVLLMRPCPGAR